jgi:hypothetical protein
MTDFVSAETTTGKEGYRTQACLSVLTSESTHKQTIRMMRIVRMTSCSTQTQQQRARNIFRMGAVVAAFALFCLPQQQLVASFELKGRQHQQGQQCYSMVRRRRRRCTALGFLSRTPKTTCRSNWSLAVCGFGDASTSQTAASTSRPESPDLDFYKIGDWEEMHGNYLLRPPLQNDRTRTSGSSRSATDDRDDDTASTRPRALIHFLGGAFVGASPHVSYRYLLERLAAHGYLVVATPYDLSFDYLATCDGVIARFEKIAGPLARAYGALPVIGVGHSCGALLQLLITSLFPDTPRAANALISYNNKPVSEAIPVFEEVIVPLFTWAATNNTSTNAGDDDDDTTTAAARPTGGSGIELLALGLQLARSAVLGQIPSDALLSHAAQLVRLPTPPIVPPLVREAVSNHYYQYYIAPNNSNNIPVVPLALQALRVLEQIPRLMEEVGGDTTAARDFYPRPDEIAAATRRNYRARRTLIVPYDHDPWDESDELEQLVHVAGQVAAMKRGVVANVQRRNLVGTHTSPLGALPYDVVRRAQEVVGVELARNLLGYGEADATVDVLVRWLEESDL